MRIDVITLFPEMFQGPMSESIVNRCIQKGDLDLTFHNPRTFSTNKHHKVDDYPYGGGAGMVMSVEPLARCLDTLLDQRSYDSVIYMTPDAKVWNQESANATSLLQNIIIVCGHYKGIDQRIRDKYISQEVSIGDFVLTGGEIPAMTLIDSVCRLLPGAIGNAESALTDSFQDRLLSPPVYTRPAEYDGMAVPAVLLSGHEQKIAEWRHEQALSRTKKIRPDLLD